MTRSDGRAATTDSILAISHPHDRAWCSTTYCRSEAGFTLLSQLFAVSMFSVLVMAMVGLAGVTAGANQVSKQKTTAVTLLQDKVEDARRAGFNYALTKDTTVTEPYGSIVSYADYKRVTSTAVDSPVSGMQTVTVTVYWNQDAKSRTLSTILAQ